MTKVGSKGLRMGGIIFTSVCALTGVALVPLTLAVPVEANAQETAIAAADAATENMAVTEKTLEEVAVPEGYTTSDAASTTEVAQEQQQVRPVEETSAAVPEELSLARALVSSPSVVFGVTFPLNNADQQVTITYRERKAEQWSEWKSMGLAEISHSPNPEGTFIMGTDPLTAVNVDEIEVSVVDAENHAIPGVKLTLIEPELEAENLEEAQLEAHGAEAIANSESVIPAQEAAPAPQTQNDQPAPNPEDKDEEVSELSSKEKGTTPAEEAEANADLALPATAGNGRAVGVASAFRTTGLTSNGQAYVTDIPGLTITTRKGWGADESAMDWDPEPVTFRGAVVHHTAGTNNYSKAQVPGLVRGIYRYHAVSLGWGDVGYHLLVDKFGGVWEGRAGGLTKAVEGGHAFGANNATFGISVLGDYMHLRPSDEAIDAVSKAIAWKFKVHGIKDLNAKFRVKGKQWGKSSIMLPVISAHRDVGGTDCPGDAFMTRMPEIRTKVAEYLKAANERPSATSQSTPIWQARQKIGSGWNIGQALYAGAFSAEGRTDAMLIDRQGLLWLYPGEGNTRFPYARKQIGRGWHSVDQVNAGTDFDGDGRTDIVARVINTGELRLYVGDGKGGFKTVKKIGTGWNMFSAIYVLPNMNDGTPVVYGVEKNTGKLRAYLTDGRGSFSRTIIMGGGWNVMRDFVSVTDKTGDRRSDLIVTDEQGDMWLYEGKNGSIGSRVQIGRGWEGFSPILNAGATGTLWTVSPDGALFRYTFEGMRKSH